MTLVDKIPEILSKFNFEIVRSYMNSVKWDWYDSENGEAPSVERMKETASELLFSAVRNLKPNTEISSGGFSVTKIENEYLVLNFVIEECYVSLENGDEPVI